MKDRSKRGRLLSNARLTKVDPTRTITLRRAFEVKLRKQFALLKGRIVLAFSDGGRFSGPIANAMSPFDRARKRDAKGRFAVEDTILAKVAVDAAKDKWVYTDLKSLHEHVSAKHPKVTPEQLHETLKSMQSQGKVELMPTTRTEAREALQGHMIPHEVKDRWGDPVEWFGYVKPGNGVANAFCPTGPGGGVDASCSPGVSTQAEAKKKIAEISSSFSQEAVKAIDRNLKKIKLYANKEEFTRGTAKYRRDSDTHGEASYSREDGILHLVKGAKDHVIAHELGHVVDGRGEDVSSRPQFIAAWRKEADTVFGADGYGGSDRTEGMAELFRMRHELGSKAVEKLAPKMTKALWVYWSGPTSNVSDPGDTFAETEVTNAFCPTGPGGGVDASCSPHQVKAEELLHTSLGEAAKEAVKNLRAKVGGKISQYIDATPGGKWCREKLGQMNEGMKSRYGEKTMKRITQAALAVSWGTSMGTTAIGAPLIIPSGALILAGAALAEVHLQSMKAARSVKRIVTGNEQEIPHVEIVRLGSKLVVDLCEGLQDHLTNNSNSPTVNDLPRWAASSSQEKLAAFQEWMKTQVSELLAGQSQEQLWKAYIHSGWKKGAGRSYDDVHRKSPQFTPEQQVFYAGGRDSFLRTSFAQPVAREKVELLASRTFDEMENVTDDMANRMSRVLADGMIQGQSPHDVARSLTETVDFSRQRAEVVARTELIRAHAEGQLTALEQLGVTEVGVEVEWLATDDEKTCPLCSDLEGTVMSISEARGMLPRHPNCRCCWVPNIEES